MRRIVLIGAVFINLPCSAFAQDQQLLWQLGPLVVYPDKAGLFDVTQSASLSHVMQRVPNYFIVNAEVKHVKVEEAEQALRPMLEAKIQAFAKQVNESVSRIEALKPQESDGD